MMATIRAILGHNVRHEESVVVTIEGGEYTLYGLIYTVKALQASNRRLNERVKSLEASSRDHEEAVWQRVRWKKIDIQNA
jgi:hypothetical protein